MSARLPSMRNRIPLRLIPTRPKPEQVLAGVDSGPGSAAALFESGLSSHPPPGPPVCSGDVSQDSDHSDARRRLSLQKKYPKLSDQIAQLNRIPEEHLLDLANDMLNLSKQETNMLHTLCRRRLALMPGLETAGEPGTPGNQKVEKMLEKHKLRPNVDRGAGLRAKFPKPDTFFTGQGGMRTLPVPMSVFSPGLFLPQLSMFFGARERYGMKGEGKESEESKKGDEKKEDSEGEKAGNS